MNIVKGYTVVFDYSKGGYIKSDEVIDLVPEEDLKILREKVNNMKEGDIDSLQPNHKIFFHKTALFPRHKLKEMLPNPITRKTERADYIVVNHKELKDRLQRLYQSEWYLDSMGDWVEFKGQSIPGCSIKGKFIRPGWHTGSLTHIETMRSTEDIVDKNIIFDTTLNQLVPREVHAKEDLYEKLTKMFTSNDLQNIKVGVEILSNMNYNESRNQILLLLNRHYEHIRRYGAAHTVMFKSLLDVATKDCPSWKFGDPLRFALGLLEGDPSCPALQKTVSNYLDQQHKLKKGKYRIVIDDVEI